MNWIMKRLFAFALLVPVAMQCVSMTALAAEARPGKDRLAGNWEMVPSFDLTKIQAALAKSSPGGKLTAESSRTLAQIKAMPKGLKFRLSITAGGKMNMRQIAPAQAGKVLPENSLLVIAKEEGDDLQVNKISAVPGVAAEQFLIRFTDDDHFLLIPAMPGLKPDPESGAAFQATRVK